MPGIIRTGYRGIKTTVKTSLKLAEASFELAKVAPEVATAVVSYTRHNFVPAIQRLDEATALALDKARVFNYKQLKKINKKDPSIESFEDLYKRNMKPVSLKKKKAPKIVENDGITIVK